MNYLANIDMIDSLLISAKRSNNNLVLLTSGGTIIGKPLDNELLKEFVDNPDSKELNKDEVEYPVSALISLFHQVQDERERDESPQNGIWLKDVTIDAGNHKQIKSPVVFVFYNQITGISLGNVK